MPTDQSYIGARIDGATKKRASRALDAAGLSVSDAIRHFMRYIAAEKRLPPALKAPSRSSRVALAELESGKYKSFNSVDGLMADLHTDD